MIDPNSYQSIDPSWLEEDSYTVSYYIAGAEENQGWISFHDYIPDYSIVLRNQNLLQFRNGDLFQHNVGPKGVFFGQLYNSTITPVIISPFVDGIKAKYPFVISNINWNTDIEDSLIRKLQETWTSISLHNSFQGTRQLPINLYKIECSILENYGTFNTKRVNNRWYYNYAFNEKDNSIERTWLELRDKFLVINTEDKGCVQEELYRTKMKDDFVIIRLLFDNSTNRKLFHYEINLDVLISTQ